MAAVGMQDQDASSSHADPGDLGILNWSIRQLGRAYRAGDISPVEVTQAVLNRIAAHDGSVHSFLTITAERALSDAARAEIELRAGVDRGPFHGVPYALKDNVDTAGISSTSHSKIYADRVPEEDAAIVERLSSGGGVLLGKTATFEFAIGGPSWDLPAPPALNPWDKNHLPGGSSSGSAAAVAANFAFGAIGTDTGGSVRWPAAVCGLAGIKPTYGRVSRRGVHPNTFSLDHCGPLARSVEDCAAMLQVIAGHDPRDPGSIDEPVPDYISAAGGSIKGLRIGLIRDWYADDAAPEVVAATDQAAATLTELGAEVQELRLSPLRDYVDAKTVISMSELFAIHEKDLRERPGDFSQSLRSRVMPGGLFRAEDYVQAMRWRTELTTKMLAAFKKFDLLATAGWLGVAEPADPAAEDFFKKRQVVTMPFSLAGIPALVLPSGFTAAGLPLSLQLAGRPFDETAVLRAGAAYQSATDWHRMRPTL